MKTDQDLNSYYQNMASSPDDSYQEVPLFKPAYVRPTEDGGYEVVKEEQIGMSPIPSNQRSAYNPPSSGNILRHSASSQGNILDNLETQLRAIEEQAQGDPISLAKGLAELDSTVAMKKADIYKETQSLMATRYNIPRLEQALQQSIALDNNTPGFREKYGDTDSAETGSIRSQLQQAMAAADGAINENLKGNPTYQSLDTAAATFKRTAEALVLKKVAKNEQEMEAASSAYNRYTPEQKKTWDTAIGNTDSSPLMAVEHYKAMPANGKEALNAVVEGGAAAVPSLTLEGNPFAKRVAVAKETELTGDPVTALAKIDNLVSIANDNAKALAAYESLKRTGAISAQDAKVLDPQIKVGLDPRLSTGGNKEETAKLRKFVAIKLARIETTQQFNSDVTALRNDVGMQMPAFLAAAKNSPTFSGKKISLEDALAVANSAPTTAERQANINALSTFYSAAVNRQNMSPLFTVDPLAPEQLKAKAVLQGFNLLGKIANIPQTIKDSVGPIPAEVQARFDQGAQESLAASRRIQGFLTGTPQ